MSAPVIITGFPPSNRVPGAFGEVLFGQGAQSAAGLPKSLLVVGLPTTGTLVTDSGPVKILSQADADNSAGPGSEGATMLYDAFKIGGNAGVPLWYASAKPAAGATAATLFIKITGTATASGSVAVRVGGTYVGQNIAIGDTGAQVCTNLAANITGYQGGRLPLSATAATTYCTVSCRTAGQRGMQHVMFLDTTLLPAGITATIYTTWTTLTAYVVGDVVVPRATPNGLYFKCTTAGTTGASEPTWPTTVGTSPPTDGSVTWTCWGSTATGNVPTTALFLGNGTGLETYTNLLAVLTSQSFDRIALAANDATSVAAWKSQVDQYAAAPYNFLQQVIVGANGTLSAAQSLAQTTTNDPRFEWLWELNCEGHPSRMAAAVGALRAMTEPSNPNPNYSGVAVTTIPPQSQSADWPTLAVLISALNNSLTPISSRIGDGFSRIERAITSKSLTSGSADYSTFDVGAVCVPDFVLQDLKLYYSSVIQPANPVVQDDPPPGQRQPISGVLTPSRLASLILAKMQQYAKGILSSSPVTGSAQVPPIVITPLNSDVNCAYDPVAQRCMAAVTTRVQPLNVQIGVSVRQSV